MGEKGMIFTGESVRAILGDRKTQTRRTVNGQSRAWEFLGLERYQSKDYIMTGHSAVYPASPSHPHLGVSGFEWVEVDGNTVGQCTGLRDLNGKLVFEADIVGIAGQIEVHKGYKGIIRFGHYRHHDAGISYVCGDYGFYVDWIENELVGFLRNDLMFWVERIEIVGNIHDRSEGEPYDG